MALSFKWAVTSAGIARLAALDSLQHRFATHLRQSGSYIRPIQELPGHVEIATTVRYTHGLKTAGGVIRNPLNALPAAGPPDASIPFA
ncbi:tyrosine-type recombinase/integrase [Paraburkholderia sp.]|uniref:tyrosine-type recombinase/integrase n=1 Tax=Paraburkholderia sp. TaxID=1926495 RepID=UPI00345C83DB